MNSDAEIKLLQTNMKELQGQLNTAHKRISELIKEKATAYDDLQKASPSHSKSLARMHAYVHSRGYPNCHRTIWPR